MTDDQVVHYALFAIAVYGAVLGTIANERVSSMKRQIKQEREYAQLGSQSKSQLGAVQSDRATEWWKTVSGNSPGAAKRPEP